jgi:hypothetical protein
MPLPLTKSKRKRQLCQDTKRDYKYRSGRTTAGEGPVEEINTTGTATVVLSSSPTLTGEPSLQLPQGQIPHSWPPPPLYYQIQTVITR